ncbi:MAG: protein kinase [Symploca sp. SIO1A3]|nr:protein kinase [Symploca sp. SIO1A3]
MIYCINPECKHRQNPDQLEDCQACGTPLLIDGRYRLIKPLRQLSPRNHTDIFEVDDGGIRKVMKVLKDDSPQLVEMFAREALTLQELQHPGIPQVDIDGYFTFTPNHSSQELHCLVMEKIEGQNLEQWISNYGSISQSLAIKWLRELIEILAVLHQNHFFHRDLKPSNIMLKPDGQLVVIDFGSVRQISNTYLAKLNLGNLTTIFSGGYTPQEQLDGKASPLSDYFALGRTFVYLLTGKHPVEFPRDSKTGKLVWRDKAPQISQPLADFIDELMATFPGDRPQNTQVILRYLTVKHLRLRSVLRLLGSVLHLLKSPQFKFTVAGLLILGISGITAIEWWTRSLRAAYYSNQGRTALMDDRLDDAKKELESAIRLNPNDAVYRSDLGFVCKQNQQFKCAIEQYQKALELKPDDVTAATLHYNLGVLYEDSKKIDSALKQYQIAMQDQGELGVNAMNNFARLQIWNKHNNGLAIALLKKALTRTENSRLKSTLYKNLGWAYLQEVEYQEAQKYLRKAISLDKDNRAAAHCLLAKALERSNPAEAITSWKNCAAFNSGNLPEVETWQLDALRVLMNNE